jgi:LmbE family N-acetylglucosaminyl deacetylase
MPTARSVLLVAPLLISTVVFGQSMNSSELLNELHKLNTLGSVLFVAAHPDDENTALLTYLAQEEKLETAYLSLTRGGGGQNLIGPELKENLGLIRANELLQARKIDGAYQLFTRARDFGYSKNPEDTLENWQEEKVLSDVVYAVRQFKPDVIITRFNPDSGPTHGHHTVSAQLALKAFRLAADSSQFPEQLKYVDTHQAKRIFWNGYGRRGPRGGRSRPSLADEEREVVSLEIGKYNPLLGTSYTEIAARSRSMHKSQGFGQAGRRGEQTERLVLLEGEPANGNFLSGVDTSWGRYSGGRKVEGIMQKAIQDFDQAAPWKVVSSLLEAEAVLESLSASRHIRAKRKALHQLIAAAMGLHFEATAGTSYLTPGDSVDLQVELINRSPIKAEVQHLEATLFDSDNWPRNIGLKRIYNLDKPLSANISASVDLNFRLPEDAPLTQPFWLQMEPDTGIYHFKNTRLLELVTVPPTMAVTATIKVEGRTIELTTPAIERLSDPIKGEVHHIVSIRPEVVLKPNASVMLFENAASKEIEVTVTSNSGEFSGKLVAEAPKGWSVDIANPQVSFSDRDSVRVMKAVIKPPSKASEGIVFFKIVGANGKNYPMSSNQIEYEHIGRQPIMARARTKLTRLDLSRAGNRIACIEGVGDPVPETLLRIGYDVDRILVEDIDRKRLTNYDTVILGPRAFDALVGLDKRFDELTAYVEAGGTLISQYNTTSSRTKSKFRSPYPLQLSSDRVSEEKADMRMLQPEHPVFNVPNKITASDFENWIQERGLYFADSWDDHYDALISANDRGEPPRDGGLLVAQYGNGWYAYTGLSFFRQLPEGNPGAIRLFVNLISLGHGN